MEGGVGQVWDPSTVAKLRSEARVVGSLAGGSPKQAATLPLILMPEEVQLLREKGLIRVVEVDWAKGKKERAEKAEAYKEQSYQGQIEEFKQERKEEILRMADKIVEGKRKKLAAKRKADGEEVVLDREEIIKQEIARIRPITRDMAAVQIFNGDPWISNEDKIPSSWSCPADNALKKCRLFTYKDLWNNGYFITDGAKFGGDFLVYMGDPARYHARYIVICREDAVQEDWRGRKQDLVALCRLGSTVKKTVLLSWMEGEEIKYKSLRRGRLNHNM